MPQKIGSVLTQRGRNGCLVSKSQQLSFIPSPAGPQGQSNKLPTCAQWAPGQKSWTSPHTLGPPLLSTSFSLLGDEWHLVRAGWGGVGDGGEPVIITIIHSSIQSFFCSLDYSSECSLTPKTLQTGGLRVFQTSVLGAPSSQFPSSQLLAKAMNQNVLNP